MTGFGQRTKDFLSSISKPEIYLIVVLVVFGLGVCFLLPVGGGYDEETHLIRVWEMSSLTFLPNDNLGNEFPFPAVYWEMSYRRPFIVRAVEADFWEKYGGLSLDSLDYIYGDVETRSVYSPPLLFPQAMVMRYLGRSLQLPALTVFYAIRIAGLLFYLILAWLSVRIIPFGKWILAILAASPVAILQASTVSADAISNGLAFLFIAGTLALAFRKEIHWKEWISFAALFLILFWGKLNIVPLAILPFLLLKPSQFKMRSGYLTLLISSGVLFLLEVAGWNLIAYSRLSTAVERADPIGQLSFILANPLQFSAILVNDIWANGFNRLLDWIAIYGFAYWPVPIWTYSLYSAGLLAAIFLNEKNVGIEKRTRMVLVIVFVITYLITILSLYISFTPVGSEVVEGVQGRYFMTVMPLLFLAFACIPSLNRIRIPVHLPVIFGITSLALYTAGMYLSYHVPCGSQYYQPGLCYQPNYKNWAPNEVYSSPVSPELTLSQEIIPECNGMSELRIWLDATGSNPNGITSVVLKDVNNDHMIVNENIYNSNLPAKAWFSLAFQPDWASSGKFYLLTIQSDEESGPRIAYSLRPEYPAGKLFENDQALGQDMIFQTGCIAGWDADRALDTP